MAVLKHLSTGIQLVLGLFPAGIAMWAVRRLSWKLALLAIIAVFVLVAILPLFRKRESLWIFVLSFLTLTPINISVIKSVSYLFSEYFWLTEMAWIMLIYLVMVSMEELTCGLVARCIWKKQYKPVMNRDEDA